MFIVWSSAHSEGELSHGNGASSEDTEKKTLVNGSALALPLFNVKSVTYVAFTIGCLPECFAHIPRREDLATSVFTAAV